MKPFKDIKTNILITEENSTAISRVLEEANGSSYPHQHSYFCFPQIHEIATKSEGRAKRLLGSETSVRGVRVIAKSGDKVLPAYKFGRRATAIEIVRRADGWYLVRVEGCWVGTSGGYITILVRPAQEQKALAFLRRRFNYCVVEKPAKKPAPALKLVPPMVDAA